MKKLLALVAALAMTFSLASCGSSPSSSEQPASTAESAQATQTEDDSQEPQAGTGEGAKVGFLIPTLQAEFFIGLDSGLKEELDAIGYELMTVSFDGDTGKAISAIENMVVSKVDVIVAMVSDNACDNALKAAQDSGIKILECGVETDVYDLCLLADNIDVGNKIGEMAADFINDDLGGTAKVAVFTTEQNLDMMNRGTGIVETLEEQAPDAEIVEIVDIGKDVVGAGTSTAETLLQKYPDLNVICAYGDFNALEAAEAVNAAGKGTDEFGVFACDATAEGLNKISNGEIFRGTIHMGDLSKSLAEYTQRLYEGETFDAPIAFENTKVTSENVDKYI